MASRSEKKCFCTLIAFMLVVTWLAVILRNYDTLDRAQCARWLHEQAGNGLRKTDANGLYDTLAETAFARRCGPGSTSAKATPDGFVLSPNLVLGHLTDPIQASTLGWWMPHLRWDTRVQCHDEHGEVQPVYSADGRSAGVGATAGAVMPVNLAEEMQPAAESRGVGVVKSSGQCSFAMAVVCKSNILRATYQYIAMKEYDVSEVNSFHVSLLASALSMRRLEFEGRFLGLNVVALHNDGTNTTATLTSNHGTYPYERAATMLFVPARKRVVAFVVMVGCYGYSGYAQFKDIELRPVVWKGTRKVVLTNHVEFHDSSENAMNEKKSVRRQERPGHQTESCSFVDTETSAHKAAALMKSQSRWHQFGLHDTCPPVKGASVQSDSTEENDDDLLQWHLYTPVNTVSKDTVTLVTQASLDRIDVVERSMKHWHGPMSLVLYVPNQSENDVNGNDMEWKKLYVRKKLSDVSFRTISSVVVVFGRKNGELYPINTLRNVAIKHAPTNMLLLLDADFIPSPNFDRKFRWSVAAWFNSSEYKSGLIQNVLQKTAFIVPAFEFLTHHKEHVTIPVTKGQVIDQLNNAGRKILAPFRVLESPQSHAPIDYKRWYQSDEPYLITSIQDKFEPYFTLPKTDSMPLYFESFRSYGMNKVAHTTELGVAGYQFVVLPNTWAIHMPHPMSQHSRRFLYNPGARLENRLVRFQFVLYLQRKYGLGQCPRSHDAL